MKRTLMITLVLSTSLLAACGSNDKMMDMNGQMSALKADNSSAMSKATEALDAANTAKADAASAKSDAAEALSTANAAKAQSGSTNSKLDSMFKKAMYK